MLYINSFICLCMCIYIYIIYIQKCCMFECLAVARRWMQPSLRRVGGRPALRGTDRIESSDSSAKIWNNWVCHLWFFHAISLWHCKLKEPWVEFWSFLVLNRKLKWPWNHVDAYGARGTLNSQSSSEDDRGLCSEVTNRVGTFCRAKMGKALKFV